MQLRRNQRVIIDGYNVSNDDGIKMTSDDNYFIYLKNANLLKDGKIVGRYLGEAKESLIDGYCRYATHDSEGYKVDGKLKRTAKMVAVRNEGVKQIIIVIE